MASYIRSLSGSSASSSSRPPVSWQRSKASKRAARCKPLCSASAEGHGARGAAKLLVDKFIKSGQVVGVGSGALVSLAVEEIGCRLAAGTLKDVVAVAACSAAAHEAAFHGVPVAPAAQVQVDVAFDEVEQLDPAQNAAVMGTSAEPQQPQLPRSRAVAADAGTFVVLVSEQNVVPRLRGTLPVVIDGEHWEEPAEELDDLMLGDAEIWRRPAFGTANPRGGEHPYVSPEGHNILDIRFDSDAPEFVLFGERQPYSSLASEIENIPGVVTHGLLLGLAHAAVVAKQGAAPELLNLKAPKSSVTA